jgi:hypothetical protein
MEDLTLPSEGWSLKNGCTVHPFSQKPWPIPQTSNIKLTKGGQRRKHHKKKKFKKMDQADPVQVSIRSRWATRGRWPLVVGPGLAGDQRSPAGRGLTPGQGRPAPLFLFLFLCCPPLFAQVVNSCWLVLAHARLAHSSPKNFKHP